MSVYYWWSVNTTKREIYVRGNSTFIGEKEWHDIEDRMDPDEEIVSVTREDPQIPPSVAFLVEED